MSKNIDPEKAWLQVYKTALTLHSNISEAPSFLHDRAVVIADKAYDAYIERFYVGYGRVKMADRLNPDGGYG